MMVSAVVPADGFEAAVRAAHKAGRAVAADGLGAPLDGSWLGKIGQVWDRIEEALRAAFVFGRDYAEDLTEAAVAEAESLLKRAGDRLRAVHEALLVRLLAYGSTLVDSALATIRPKVVVGGIEFELAGVDISQKVSLTGSLKTNIADLVALTGAGEVTVMARYGSLTA